MDHTYYIYFLSLKSFQYFKYNWGLNYLCYFSPVVQSTCMLRSVNTKVKLLYNYFERNQRMVTVHAGTIAMKRRGSSIHRNFIVLKWIFSSWLLCMESKERQSIWENWNFAKFIFVHCSLQTVKQMRQRWGCVLSHSCLPPLHTALSAAHISDLHLESDKLTDMQHARMFIFTNIYHNLLDYYSPAHLIIIFKIR